jgi:hypothetical protein
MLKDLGAIALFIGVLLNAYHYYKLHSWSKKDKNLELILKIIDNLKTIRDKMLLLQIKERKLTNSISLFSHSLDDGKPTHELCYELMTFEENMIRLYDDYLFFVNFKRTIERDNMINYNASDDFLLKTQNKLEGDFISSFRIFYTWENIMKSHSMDAYVNIMERFLVDKDMLEKLFKD